MRRCWTLGPLMLALNFATLANAQILPRSAQFNHQPPQAGDASMQVVNIGVDLTIQQMRGAERTTAARQRIQRQQVREVRVVAGSQQAATAAQVTYRRSHQATLMVNDVGSAVDHPVVGKTYNVRRQGDDLIVTDQAGVIPPPDELQLVRANMDSLGRPNVLGEFLHGKKIGVGDTLELPPEAVNKWLDLQAIEQAQSFKLKLTSVKKEGDRRLAKFSTVLSTTATEEDASMLQMRGEIMVDVATCRVTSLQMAGDFRIVQVVQEDGVEYKVRVTGSANADMTTSPSGSQPVRQANASPPNGHK